MGSSIVGLVTAIVTIVTGGFKISRAILQARPDFGAATANFRGIAMDTEMFMLKLRQIRDRICVSKTMNPELANVVDEILPRCKADIEDIKLSLLPLITNSEAIAGPLKAPLALRSDTEKLLFKDDCGAKNMQLQAAMQTAFDMI